ncbi:hypothetical protein BDV96DRAFT_657996, partial [Lophiotrema nucula]
LILRDYVVYIEEKLTVHTQEDPLNIPELPELPELPVSSRKRTSPKAHSSALESSLQPLLRLLRPLHPDQRSQRQKHKSAEAHEHAPSVVAERPQRLDKLTVLLLLCRRCHMTVLPGVLHGLVSRRLYTCNTTEFSDVVDMACGFVEVGQVGEVVEVFLLFLVRERAIHTRHRRTTARRPGHSWRVVELFHGILATIFWELEDRLLLPHPFTVLLTLPEHVLEVRDSRRRSGSRL